MIRVLVFYRVIIEYFAVSQTWSQLLYEFICRSVMINKRQRECVLSKWSPNLATFRYQSKAVYTDFYQNICLSPWDQIQHFTVAPPRTTFSVPILNKRLLISNSDNRGIKNHKSVNSPSDIAVNRENKKKPSFEMVFHSTQIAPLPNTANESIHRFIKSAQTTVSPSQKQTSCDVDYDEDRSSGNGSNKDCDDNNSDDNEDYDDDDDDDDDDGDDDIYYDGFYKNSDRSSDFISSNDAQPTTANKDITYRIAGSLLIPVKNVPIRPGPITTHRSFHTPLVKINSAVLFPSTTVITPSISDNTIINANFATSTTTITAITSISTTTIATKIATAFTTNATSKLQFIPVPIDKLIPEWNTTTKDSELSIQYRNSTLNIGIIQQNPDKRQMIRDGLIEQLECFHYFANNQLNDYEQEIIKQIGLQDCLHNCILRVAFLCLSVNYKNQTKECILNGGNRMINNAQLVPSRSTDYYEYVCLTARKHESNARNESEFLYIL
ncbi:unnamed protein product [Onchocerca ochengi]|uniref:Apple domain-containing protein n=1 Tax=Onchocerca ochengi TaxID=42157 RepID=A0A182EK23_ONCOC|nr:unnamed protein product [Onchocerca ochengi]